MYLTYEQYQSMGGTLDETTFNDYEFEAESVINWHTFNRFKKDTEYPQELTRLMYKLIALMQDKAQSMSVGDTVGDGSNQAIASQSNDGVSVSYNVMSAADIMKAVDEEVKNCVRMYLQDVTNSLGHKVLYRGLYPGE